VSARLSDPAVGIEGFERSLARLYVRRVLDGIVDAADAVAYDFAQRPSLYRDASDGAIGDFTALRSGRVSRLDFSRAHERDAASRLLVGPRLVLAFAPMRRAAIVLLERGTDRSDAALRQSFDDAALMANFACAELDEAEIDAACDQTGAEFAAAVEVLMTTEVAEALDQQTVPQGGWPSGGIYSAEMASLCQAATRQIEKPGRLGAMSASKFVLMQRVAHFGSATISSVLDGTGGSPEQIDASAHAAYSWSGVLNDLLARVDVVRAWTSSSYRKRLEIAERDVFPANPAGDIDLSGTPLDATHLVGRFRNLPDPEGGWLTVTVNGELCCVTADVCTAPTGTNYCGVTDTGFTCRTSSVCLCLQ
jgi:mersacidin/lichenicidin family type 2 lantibiotic